MLPDVQTLCLPSSIRSTPKQLHQCLCLSRRHFRITIFTVLIPSPFNYPPKSLYWEAVFHTNWLWNFMTETPSFYRLLEISVRLHLLPLPLPFLSTPLDFNQRYSRGSANERSSPRVHPKVTHLKPRTSPREKLPYDYGYYDTALLPWIKCQTNTEIIVGMFWVKRCMEMNLLHCVFQFCLRTFPAAIAS